MFGFIQQAADAVEEAVEEAVEDVQEAVEEVTEGVENLGTAAAKNLISYGDAIKEALKTGVDVSVSLAFRLRWLYAVRLSHSVPR